MKLRHLVQALLTISIIPSFMLTTQAYAADTGKDISPAERARIEEVVQQYLTRKPEVIMEAIQALQRKQYEQAEQTVKQTQSSANRFADALFHQGNDPVAGNPKGKITVVEFFDYQCPHCVDMAPVLDEIIKANPDLRIIFKEFPIRGPMSELAAKAALAANKQGKYLELHRALLTANQPLTEEMILTLAGKVSVNVDQLKKDMKDSSISDQLKSNYKLAQNLKLFGTPAFFVGKTTLNQNAPAGSISYVPGRTDQQQLQALIDQAGK